MDGRAREIEDVDPLDQPPHPCMMLAGHYDEDEDPEEFTIHTRENGEELVTEWMTAPVSETVTLEEVR